MLVKILSICDAHHICKYRNSCSHAKPHLFTESCNRYPCEIVSGGAQCILCDNQETMLPNKSLRDALVQLLKKHRHRYPALEADFMLRCLEAHNIMQEEQEH